MLLNWSPHLYWEAEIPTVYSTAEDSKPSLRYTHYGNEGPPALRCSLGRAKPICRVNQKQKETGWS